MNQLKLAENISNEANKLWQSGELLNKVSYTSAELLKYWFGEEYCVAREKNFHQGQKQAILNTIYLHEVAKINNVLDIHEHFANENFLFEDEKVALTEEKYSFPKYCVKMATGTGKTWVMHALILWQILNYQREKSHGGRFTNNFLLIAPGKIVYNRLLDAFKGKTNIKSGEREFDSNDFKLNEELFIPYSYRDEVYGFLQNNVKDKDNIDGITSGGLIAITNWHIFIDRQQEKPTEEDNGNARAIIKDLLPAKPGTSAGNSLEVLDNGYLRGKSLEYLSNLDSLMIINDEAHHLHDSNTKEKDVVWQQGIDYVLQNKTKGKLQIDFSATPYTTIGSGERKKYIYFPHIITDFDLKHAMRQGLVKLINLVCREELTDVELSYKAIRDENNEVVGLSEGQRIMLSAGLKKLDILDEAFKELTTEKDSYKQPKMLIMCEDTKVSPFVVDFLLSKGLGKDDVMQIDSTKEGEVSDKEWEEIKGRLFNMDNLKKPRVIVSVLMLREGFDVNNICVIVPLRTTDSDILLEQTIGRGLRLMFRGKEFEQTKEENRELLFSHKEPNSMIDMLSIVEHPNFIQYYNKLLEEGFATIQDNESNSNVKGDLVSIGLKEEYEEYDLYFPKILRSEQEELQPIAIDIQDLKPFDLYPLEQLQKLLAKDGEVFNSTDVLSTTHFGKYEVNANPFTANTYNEYLQKILFAIINYNARTNKRAKPLLQINNAYLIASIDNFIRHRLFDCEFNPFENNNWKILLVSNGIVTIHIQKEFSSKINDLMMNIEISSAQINKRFFSEVQTMLVRREFSVKVEKSIYSYLPFSSKSGGLEKAFMEYIDRDSEVESFIKINEYKHRFANIYYVNEDGLLHTYYPDFIVKTKEKFYIIETKGKDRISSENVKRKRTAILEWVERINKVTLSLIDNRIWEYVLLRDDNFYNYAKQGISFVNMCNLNKVTSAEIKETLF